MTTPDPSHLAEAKTLLNQIGAHMPAQAAQAHALISIAESLAQINERLAFPQRAIIGSFGSDAPISGGYL